MTLGILLPTRGRPQNLDRFIDATVKTAVNWRLYLRVDFDDPELDGYERVFKKWSSIADKITVARGDRIRFGPSLNELAMYAEVDGMSHVGMFGDDVVPIDNEWDIALTQALGDQMGVSYGDDGLRDKHAPDLPTHYVTSIEVYRRLGYLSPPGINHLFLDNVARDIGRHLKNFVYVPVKIRHLHPWVEGEQIHDATYAEGGRSSEIRSVDHRAYVRWGSRQDWKRRLK